MIKSKEASEEDVLPLGFGLIGLVLAGSLWACIGFIGEWVAIELGLLEEVAHQVFRGIGFGTAGLACAALVYGLNRFPNWKKQAAVGLSIYLPLAFITPRWFTYDTGLYHVPFINHLYQIGLEWNLGSLHSRYSFFNLLLYGQAALSRLADSISLPSLNGIILTGLLLILINEVKSDWKQLAPCLVISGALLLPTESTESFHSYNADFALGCIFLSCCLLITNRKSVVKPSPYLIGVAMFIPAIKISGLFLIPAILYAAVSRWGITSMRWQAKPLAALLAVIVLTITVPGYITSGYLFYPVAATGPLREDGISKELALSESKISTIGWARFAYSGQIDELKPDAKPHEWLPKWAKSQNGRKMLGYLFLSIATTFASLKLTRLQRWRPILITTSLLWGLAIFVLPPDPRFYVGLTLTNLYCGTVWLAHPDIIGLHNPRRSAIALFLLILLGIVIPSTLRPSGYGYGNFPEANESLSSVISDSGYKPRGGRTITRSASGTCWDLPAPCKP